MKYSNSITLALAIACGFTLSSRATDTVIVNDTWADGDRTSSGPDGGGIDSQWFGSGGSLSVPAAGDLRGTVPAGSAFWTTYFAPSGSPITLVNPGDELSVTWVFTPTTITQNSSQAFNLAIANTPSGARTSTDASPASGVYSGYSMFMNMAPTFANASPFALREWVVGSGALLGTAGNWGANGVASANLANGATSGNHGYDSATQYTYTMTLTRNAANGLDIFTTMVGGTINGTGGMTNSITDASPNSFAFDTFAVRPSGSASGAAQVDSSLFKVDFITSVPEPTTFALAGLGLLGLAGYRRMRR